MSSLRNIFIPSVLLFSLVGVACSNKNATTECDQTKFDCTPKLAEVAVSEPIVTEVSASESITVKEEVIETANISNTKHSVKVNDDLPKIKKQLKPLIKEEMNFIMGTNYDGWNVMINSVTDDPKYKGERWIVKYDVSTGEKGMVSDECTAWAQISSEDNTTVMVTTWDSQCYSSLKQYVS